MERSSTLERRYSVCVLRKTEREREKGRALEKGARDDDPGKEAEKERGGEKWKKKKKKKCTRVHAQLHPLEYT